MASQNSQPNPNPYSPTLLKKKVKSYTTLRKEDSCMIITADKAVTLVIMDKDMYIEKYMASYNDEEVYHECRDQTKSIHS